MIIKICGMRDAQNIREVDTLRPTMMGFICWDGSSRNVSECPAYLPQCIRVGVFVEPTMSLIRTKVNQLSLGRIQLHGNESPEFCQQVVRETGLPIIKAISVKTAEDIEKFRSYVGIADMFLFDTKCKTKGGSGEQFDWDILHHYDGDVPFLLAGGIGPNDADRLKAFQHPRMLGIDINSRFEIRKALKDINALSVFIHKIRE